MGAISGDINSMIMECVDEIDLASRPINALRSGDRAYVLSKEAEPRLRADFSRHQHDQRDGRNADHLGSRPVTSRSTRGASAIPA